jgi:hypothetical protein
MSAVFLTKMWQVFVFTENFMNNIYERQTIFTDNYYSIANIMQEREKNKYLTNANELDHKT